MNSAKNCYFLRNSRKTCRNVFGIINGDKIPKVLAIRKCFSVENEISQEGLLTSQYEVKNKTILTCLN